MRPKFIIFIFLCELLIASVLTGTSESFWKIQKQKNNDILKSESTKPLPNTKEASQTKVMRQKFDPQPQGNVRLPRVVERLCSNQGEHEFITQDGQQHTFRKSAASIQRCDSEEIWEVAEDGAEVTDAATFYFDENGVLLDICQPLFWRSGCTRFQHVSCQPRDYCEDG